MNVELTQAAKVAAPNTPASTAAASRTTAANRSLFSTHLAAASTKATASSDTSSTSGSTSTKTPKGEKTEAVKGHSYSEVIAGPRNGMFINNSGNARDGQAFARVRRDGREFHIYGSGKNRVIVEVKHKDKTQAPADNTQTQTPTDNSTSGSTGSSGTSGSTSPATDSTGAPAA
jgi:hypothetical protein